MFYALQRSCSFASKRVGRLRTGERRSSAVLSCALRSIPTWSWKPRTRASVSLRRSKLPRRHRICTVSVHTAAALSRSSPLLLRKSPANSVSRTTKKFPSLTLCVSVLDAEHPAVNTVALLAVGWPECEWAPTRWTSQDASPLELCSDHCRLRHCGLNVGGREGWGQGCVTAHTPSPLDLSLSALSFRTFFYSICNSPVQRLRPCSKIHF